MPFAAVAKFPFGNVVATRLAAETLFAMDIENALLRHVKADWGDACAEDKASNDAALAHGGRHLTDSTDRNGVKFWIITEADRSATTILLPGDY